MSVESTPVAERGTGRSSVTLRFLAAPTDAAFMDGTAVGGGRVLEWIDKAAYACAVGWSGGYCVTAYVGDVTFSKPIHSGQLVEANAHLVHTGRSSMHVRVVVSAADPKVGTFERATSCLVVFVAVDGNGKSVPVPPWEPATESEAALARTARGRIDVRSRIETAMKEQTYSDASRAPEVTLRFLASPTDVNWGGKTHGGTVMRWIDEAGYACTAGWSGARSIAVYSGGIRFYRPILIGDLVEVRARLIYTGRRSMHVSVHVSSGRPQQPDMQLTTHCLSVFVALGPTGQAAPVPRWHPELPEDVRLEAHARHLVQLRTNLRS